MRKRRAPLSLGCCGSNCIAISFSSSTSHLPNPSSVLQKSFSIFTGAFRFAKATVHICKFNIFFFFFFFFLFFFFSLYFIFGYNSGSAYPISIKSSLQLLQEYTELSKESFRLFDSFDSLVSQFDSFGDISGSTYSIFVKPNLTFSV